MSELPEVRPRPLASPGTLASRLLEADPAVAGLLPDPRGSHGDGGPGAPRLGIEAFGVSSPAAREKLERILAGRGRVVTTGQQPLLFLGPLFVVYKALTAIETARALEEEDGTPTLALFWIASDDHDWAEIGRTSLLDPANELQTLTLRPPEGRAGRPAGPTPLPEEISSLVDRMRDLLPPSDFRDDHLDLLRDAYRPGVPLGDAFASALGSLLDGHAFAWLDAGRTELKRASVGLFRLLLERAAGAAEALRAGAGAVRATGHEPPVPILDEALPLMVDTGAARERLYGDGGALRPGRAGEPEPLAAWVERLESTPGSFSPNVASRPLLESWLLPVRATVLGPGELGYWSQLPPLFDAFDVPFPRLVPRAAWTLVERKIERTLERLGATVEEMEDGGGAVIERLTREGRPARVDRELGRLRGAIGEGFGALEAAVRDELPGVRSAVGKARKLAFDAADELGSTIDARVREREETEVRQARKCALHLFPDGRPQERVASPFYYLSRYGPPLLDRLGVRTRERVADAKLPGT